MLVDRVESEDVGGEVVVVSRCVNMYVVSSKNWLSVLPACVVAQLGLVV